MKYVYARKILVTCITALLTICYLHNEHKQDVKRMVKAIFPNREQVTNATTSYRSDSTNQLRQTNYNSPKYSTKNSEGETTCYRWELFESRTKQVYKSWLSEYNHIDPLHKGTVPIKSHWIKPKKVYSFTHFGRFGNQLRQLSDVVTIAMCNDGVVLLPDFMKPYLQHFHPIRQLEQHFPIYYSRDSLRKATGIKITSENVEIFNSRHKLTNITCSGKYKLDVTSKEFRYQSQSTLLAIFSSLMSQPRPMLKSAIQQFICSIPSTTPFVAVHSRWKEGDCIRVCKHYVLKCFDEDNHERIAMAKQISENRSTLCPHWDGKNGYRSACEMPEKRKEDAWETTKQSCGFCWMDIDFVNQELEKRNIDKENMVFYIATDGQLGYENARLKSKYQGIQVEDVFPGELSHFNVAFDQMVLALSDVMIFPPVSTFSLAIARMRVKMGVGRLDTTGEHFMSTHHVVEDPNKSFSCYRV